ncbi:DUF2334 domain-containing protein [Salinimicrobium sp. TH3]|uniref:DUF2334 domain-containing protein n=1 Tax=Salinimicrobium sp. TH3 TaxID=2997342 RepID=UPI0022749E96|nr:DUF2334 domain-containing protein [Salinimicrobium sp. TH3]MCY2686972.1 DUF2334 domain-containing protein [Salinimicrobium sp. TH3]
MLNWKPPGKKAAICFTIDDIHPAKSTDFYEAGGDLEKGALGLVKWLLDRHPKLKVTLFTTADWREISPVPTRKVLASIPGLREKFYLARRWKKGTMNLENHPEFVQFLNEMERAEIAYHGLYHVHRGLKIPVEFQDQSEEEFKVILDEMLRVFQSAGIEYVKGICPPGWNAPGALLDQLSKHDFDFVASARDIFTAISKDAKTNMSGIKGEPLIYPSILKNKKIIHFPTNFQANSTMERAKEIITNEGLLSIKAHIVKYIFGYTAIDGVDELYMNYLDVLLTNLEQEYGDDLWWTSMGEISEHIKNNN